MHSDRVFANRRLSTDRSHACARFEFQLARARGTLAVAAGQDQRVAPCAGCRRALRAGQASREPDLARLIRGQPHHDHLIDRARENLAGEAGAVGPVADACDGRVEVELTPVVLNRGERGKPQQQTSDGLVGSLPEWPRHHLRFRELVRLAVLARENQRAHLGQRRQRLGIGWIVGPSTPQRVFVERDVFFNNATEDHSAQAPIAHRQGLFPLDRRSPVPEQQRLGGARRLADELAGKCRDLVAAGRLGTGRRTCLKRHGNGHERSMQFHVLAISSWTEIDYDLGDGPWVLGPHVERSTSSRKGHHVGDDRVDWKSPGLQVRDHTTKVIGGCVARTHDVDLFHHEVLGRVFDRLLGVADVDHAPREARFFHTSAKSLGQSHTLDEQIRTVVFGQRLQPLMEVLALRVDGHARACGASDAQLPVIDIDGDYPRPSRGRRRDRTQADHATTENHHRVARSCPTAPGGMPAH